MPVAIVVLRIALACLSLFPGQESGQPDREIVESLIRRSEDPDHEVRLDAVQDLAFRGLPIKKAVPALIRLLGDENDEIRVCAVLALSNIGTDAKAAVAALVQALKSDKAHTVRLHSANALGNIADEASRGIVNSCG
jgi:HEAT repeat protein